MFAAIPWIISAFSLGGLVGGIANNATTQPTMVNNNPVVQPTTTSTLLDKAKAAAPYVAIAGVAYIAFRMHGKGRR